MPLLVRRRSKFRKHLTIILLSVLAGIIAAGLVGITTSQPSHTQGTAEGTS